MTEQPILREAMADVLADFADVPVPYVADNPEVPVPFRLTPQGEAAAETPGPGYAASLGMTEAELELWGPDYDLDEPWWRVPAGDPAHPDHDCAVATARDAELDASDNWDCQDSNEYQARVEAGLGDDYEADLEPEA